MPKELDVMGHRFGRLIAIRKITPPGTRSKWECRCDCGAITIAALSHLRGGQTRSCGCLRREVSVALFTRIGRQNAGKRVKHGHAPYSRKRSPTYGSWSAIKTRCLNPNATDYERYGGSGIKLCERWLKFENFLADMGEAPGPGYQVHRKDSARGYEPGNCEWLTKGAHSTLHGKERAARGELGQGPRDPVTGRFTRGA